MGPEARSTNTNTDSKIKNNQPFHRRRPRHVQLDHSEEKRMEDLEGDMFGYDEDMGYYDYDGNDNWSTNVADGAFCHEALDSCWDNSE